MATTIGVSEQEHGSSERIPRPGRPAGRGAHQDRHRRRYSWCTHARRGLCARVRLRARAPSGSARRSGPRDNKRRRRAVCANAWEYPRQVPRLGQGMCGSSNKHDLDPFRRFDRELLPLLPVYGDTHEQKAGIGSEIRTHVCASRCRSVSFCSMRIARKVVSVAVLLLAFAAPAMACLQSAVEACVPGCPSVGSYLSGAYQLGSHRGP